jgi:hypothetical protein
MGASDIVQEDPRCRPLIELNIPQIREMLLPFLEGREPA